MNTHIENKIGRPAAILSAFFAIAYSVFQLLVVFKRIPHPQDLFWLFLPSLFLAYTFLVTVICLHHIVLQERKVFTAIAGAFAVLYCAFVSIVYFTQLAVVLPALATHKIDETSVLAFTDKSFLVAVDCLGYASMNAATLFLAFAFRNNGRSKWLYRSLLANGLQTPVVILAYFIPAFMFVGALWMVTLPAAMIGAANFFRSELHHFHAHPGRETYVLQASV